MRCLSLASATLLLLTCACYVDLAGRRCDDEHVCLEGYLCVEGRCTTPFIAEGEGAAEGEGEGAAEGEGEGAAEGEGEGEGAAEGEGEGAGCTDDTDGDQHGTGCVAGPDCAEGDGLLHTTLSLFADVDNDGVTVGAAADVCTNGTAPQGYRTTQTATDNCPDNWNPSQTNDDNDATGNACDPCTDADSDGYGSGASCTGSDCNDDNNGIHAAVGYFNDEDLDGFSWGGSVQFCSLTPPAGFLATQTATDNCPLTANPSQADGDSDLVGDACDATPATPGSSFFFDPFDGTSFLSDWIDLVGSHELTGAGEYRKRENEQDGLFVRVFGGSSDVVVSTDAVFANLDSENTPNHLGVMARSSTDPPYTGFACIASRDSSTAGTARIIEVGRSGNETVSLATTLVESALPSAPNDNSRYQFSFEVVGTSLTCTVTPNGGTPVVVSATSSAHASGRVGLYARNAEIRARWFLVTTR